MVELALGLRGGLECLSHPLDLVAEVAEVILADGYGKDFVDNGREVSQRSNRRQRRRIVETETAGGGENQCIFNCDQWHTALVE